MKDSNKKFEGFAHHLIAESLKRWAHQSNFVAVKLEERLRHPLDALDQMIAEVMFDADGNMDLKKSPPTANTSKSSKNTKENVGG